MRREKRIKKNKRIKKVIERNRELSHFLSLSQKRETPGLGGRETVRHSSKVTGGREMRRGGGGKRDRDREGGGSGSGGEGGG